MRATSRPDAQPILPLEPYRSSFGRGAEQAKPSPVRGGVQGLGGLPRLRRLHPSLLASLALLCFASTLVASSPCDLDGLHPNPGGHLSDRARELDFDGVIHRALRTLGSTPGLAVGVVDRGEVIYSRGFGRRDFEACQPVTPSTVFYLYSVTKSLTGLAAAQLHEKGKVELDSSLADAFEDLTMPSPVNPGQTSLRDLLTHRPGFWSGGINYRSVAPANLGREDLLHLLRNYARATPPRFQYSNLGYVIAAAAIEEQTGMAWRQMLEEVVFKPAGMNQSTTSIADAQRAEFARTYSRQLGGSYVERPVKTQAQMHAAGGACSNTEDMLRWVRLHLAGGQLDGQQVFPARVLRQVQAPQIQFELSYGSYQRYAYGLGLHHARLDDELTLHHFGGPIHFSLQPLKQRGLILMSSGTDSTAFVHELARLLYRMLEHGPDAARELEPMLAPLQERLAKRLQGRSSEEQQLAQRRRYLVEASSFYAGVYHSDRLGDIRLEAEGNTVHLEYGEIRQQLIPLEAHTFEAYLMPLGGGPNILKLEPEEGDGVLYWDDRRFERQRESP